MDDIGKFLGPILPTIGFGGAAGLVVGYTAKKLTKALALFLGLAFIVLQLGVYAGFVTVGWDVVQGSADLLWANPHGLTLPARLWALLTTSLPFGGGFAAGFVIGIKFG